MRLGIKGAGVNKELKGSLSILLSCLFFSFASITVKLISGQVSSLFISFIRFLVGTILIAAALWFTKKGFKVNDFKYWFLRGFFGVIAMVTFYFAIQMTSSGRATLLSDTYPVFVALYGFIIFREPLRINRALSILLCMAGVLLVFYDNSRYGFMGNLIGLISGAAGGMAVHYIKKAREKNNSIIVYLSSCLLGMVFCSVSIPEVLKIHNLFLYIPLCLVGVFAFTGQMLMGYGFKYVSTSKGSILGFTEIITTVFFSYFLGEDLRPKFFIGGTVLIAGLVINQTDGFMIWRKITEKMKMR